MYVHHMCAVTEEEAPESPELELQVVVSHHLGAGNWTLESSTRIASVINYWGIPPVPFTIF